MAKPGRNTIILGGLAVVAVLGWLAWDRLQPAGLPAGFASANGRIEATEVDIAALTGGRMHARDLASLSTRSEAQHDDEPDPNRWLLGAMTSTVRGEVAASRS